MQFRFILGQDPHEVYLNAFASYGWIGGLAFFAFTATVLFVGWRLVFRRGPYQTEVIPVWSCLVVQMVQGLQIDTDHWRHLYLLFGLLFGFAAADRMARAHAPDGSDEPKESLAHENRRRAGQSTSCSEGWVKG